MFGGAAAGLGAAGLRPARLRARRVRRRGPAARQRARQAQGSWPVIIPPSPGVLCAYGDATTSLRDEAARTLSVASPTSPTTSCARSWTTWPASAAAPLTAEGVARGRATSSYQVDLRYHGQGFEIPVRRHRRLRRRRQAAGGARQGVRHRARPVVLLRARRRARAGQRSAPPSRGRVPRWAPSSWRRAAATRRARVQRHQRSGPTAAWSTRTSTTGRCCGGQRRHRPRHRSPRWTPRPWCCRGHAATVHPSGSLLIRPVDQSQEG